MVNIVCMEKTQFNQFPIMSMEPFSCLSNQTKRQITTTLAIFNHPTQAKFLPNEGQIASAALEELTF